MKTFDNEYFLGYVNEVTPQYVRIHFPSSHLLGQFVHRGSIYAGGNVGNFVVIEGDEYGFLARIVELELPDSERKEISEKAIHQDSTKFHPSGKAELLLVFNLFEPNKTIKTISKYPTIGAKVYSCSDEQIGIYVKEFGKKKDDNEANVYAELGKLTSNDSPCRVSLNALFGRHCAIVGTTGGGKSWTVAKLIEETREKTNTKIILIDATGEYKGIGEVNCVLGTDVFFPYQKLTIPDLFFLLRPTGQSQRPILLEAIRSLKVVKIGSQHYPIKFGENSGLFPKAGRLKQDFLDFYRQNIKEIEDNKCDFDINKLASQIKNECIYANGFNDTTKWGGDDAKTYDYQTSLISRITDLLNTDVFNKLFGFHDIDAAEKSIIDEINTFITGNNTVLRIGFEEIPALFSAKEIIANSIASYMLNLARREKKFIETPIVFVVDEAHQFLNKSIKDEYFESQTLDAFDLIAKECRKYGLFLCLATQMPRDIPIGTLSQIGTFIVHRLINEQDKNSIENASSSANKNVLSFLPILGEGEAVLIGVDFPMPLMIKIGEPIKKPKSNTPTIKSKK